MGEVFVNKILQGDCLDIMKDIDNDTFDIIVSSPPYNIGINYNTYEDKKVDYIDWQVKVWEEAFRVLKPTGHLFLNIQPSRQNPLWCYELVSKLSWKLQNTIIWNKQLEIDNHIRGQGTSFQSEKYLPNGWEFVFHLTKDGKTPISQERSSVPYNPQWAESNAKRNGKAKWDESMSYFFKRLDFFAYSHSSTTRICKIYIRIIYAIRVPLNPS